jgi:hypothetical protein
MTTLLTQVPEIIQHGMDYLDAKHPGWESKIDLDTLMLDSNTKCVLAQVARAEGLSLNEIASEAHLWANEHLQASIESLGFVAYRHIDATTATWLRAIHDRLEVKA